MKIIEFVYNQYTIIINNEGGVYYADIYHPKGFWKSQTHPLTTEESFEELGIGAYQAAVEMAKEYVNQRCQPVLEFF